MLHLVVDRFFDRGVRKLLAHEFFGVINVVGGAVLCLRIPGACAVHIQLGAVHERTPLRVSTLLQQYFHSIRGVSFFQSPTKIAVPMRIDERERQGSTAREALLQLSNQISHLRESRVRKHGIREDEIKFKAEMRERQIADALGVEGTVVTIVMNEVRSGKCPATFEDRSADNVQRVVVLVTDRASRIEQQVSFVAAEIEHSLSPPVGVPELRVEVGKLRGLDELRAQRLLLGCAAPEMNFFDRHKGVGKVHAKVQRRKETLKKKFATLRLCVKPKVAPQLPRGIAQALSLNANRVRSTSPIAQ